MVIFNSGRHQIIAILSKSLVPIFEFQKFQKKKSEGYFLKKRRNGACFFGDGMLIRLVLEVHSRTGNFLLGNS